MIKEALEKNVDLGKYSKKIDKDLNVKELESIKDYIINCDELVNLHDQIQNCDKLLESMQNMLSGFQDHLKVISGEIRHLQDKSLKMNVELQNKKVISYIYIYIKSLHIIISDIINIGSRNRITKICR